jgi:glucose/arabinose dehydrogenase
VFYRHARLLEPFKTGRYKIAFVPFKEGKPVSGPEDFLTDWMLDPEKPEVWRRPVGLLQLADGSRGGKIWRVFYKG